MPSESEENASRRSSGRFDPLRAIDFLGSVKFGIALLIAIIAVSFAGMIVTQFNVPGFDRYFAGLSPFRQNLFGALGLFDVYGSWYFKGLLMLLAFNILLSSVEHYPNAWKLIRKPPLNPSEKWIRAQEPSAEFHVSEDASATIATIADACRKNGFRHVRTSEKNGVRYLFAESGAWNRLGAYAVHVALLTILAGGLITSEFSYSGELPLTAGEVAGQINEIVFREGEPSINYRRLPFTVKCIDLEQKLIDRKGPLESTNSIDWLTTIEFSDENGNPRAVVGLNRPVDHSGFRFYHSTFLPIGKARSVTIDARTAAGSERLTMFRNDESRLADGTRLKFVDFRANLELSRDSVNENSVDYRNPAAIIEATAVDGSRQTVFAVRDNQPGDRSRLSTFRDTEFRLIDFEKVSERHVLIVRRDPGAPVVYAGFGLLVVSLLAVFMFQHRRVWFAVTASADGGSEVVAGADANRDQESLVRRFKRLIAGLG